MTLNKTTLLNRIKTKLESSNINFVNNAQANLVWLAIAEAIIEEIQSNAIVTDEGTILIPAGQWSIQ